MDGELEGFGVGLNVGDDVGSLEGSVLGADVSTAFVGAFVGSGVGAVVSASVGARVGARVVTAMHASTISLVLDAAYMRFPLPPDRLKTNVGELLPSDHPASATTALTIAVKSAVVSTTSSSE